MNLKRQWTRVLVLINVLAFFGSAEAVSTKGIDDVRQKALLSKEVLENADLEEIDTFWAEAVTELLLAEKLSEIVEIRSLIFDRRGNDKSSQYSAAFITSGKNHLTSAFNRVQSFKADQQKTWLERNLIILTAQLESPELLELGLRMIGHEDATIRYWAVKALTNPGIVKQFNSQNFSDTGQAVRIIQELETTAKSETHPEIISLIVTFAGQVNEPLAKNLLTNIADLRTSAYENWTVKYELMDAKLLRYLGNEILSQSSQQNKAVISRKFAQLYSYAMQRFILGEGILSDDSKQQLASVLVEVEQSVLDKLLGRPQSSIRKAVEKILTTRTGDQKDYSALQAEHDTLLGAAAVKGELPAALNFDYGKKPDGGTITRPKKLGPPPEELPETEAADETSALEDEAVESESEDTELETETSEAD